MAPIIQYNSHRDVKSFLSVKKDVLFRSLEAGETVNFPVMSQSEVKQALKEDVIFSLYSHK